MGRPRQITATTGCSGAQDPLSSQISLMEEAKSLSALAKTS